MAVGLMQEDMKRLNEYIENYLSEVTTEQNRIAKMVEQLAYVSSQSHSIEITRACFYKALSNCIVRVSRRSSRNLPTFSTSTVFVTV